MSQTAPDSGNPDIPEPQPWSLRVDEVSEVTPSMRRIRFVSAEGAPDIGGLRCLPGQDMAIGVPVGDGTVVRRRYTIRAFDAGAGTLDADFVMHGDGPAARWAAGATPGQVVEVVAPRGKILVDRTAAWHLFAGDDSAIPVTSVMVAALPSGSRATVVLEVESESDEQPIGAPEGVGLEVTWLHRSKAGVAPGEGNLLLRTLEEIALADQETGHAYLAGEFSTVQAMRKALAGRGLDQAAISPKPYWRLGRRNLSHGEPDRGD